MSTAEKTSSLAEGMRLTREEFLRRWEALPEVKFAELLDGVVHMPSPLGVDHGKCDSWLGWWMASYAFATAGCEALENATWLMGSHAPQPDVSMRILPTHGGASTQRGRLASGSPELIIEISVTTAGMDRNEKLEIYQRNHVPEYLVITLNPAEARWLCLEDEAYTRLEPGEDGVIRSHVFPGLWLDPVALFAEDAERFQRVAREGLASPEHAAFVERLRAARTAQEE